MYKQRYKTRAGKSKERWVETWREECGDGQRRRYVTAPTRGALRAKLDQLRAAAKKKARGTGADEAVGAYLDRWVETLRHSVRPGTVESYRRHCRLYLKPHLGHIRLGQLLPSDVNAMLDALADQGLASATIGQSRATLRRALRQLVVDDVLMRNPASLSRAPKRATPEMLTWTAEEAGRFLELVQRTPLEALWVLAILRGMRIGEILGLQWKRVDFKARTLRIDVSLQKVTGAGLRLMGTKTTKSTRTIALLPECAAALERHQAQQRLQRMASGGRWDEHDLVFTSRLGTPLWPGDVRRRFWAFVEASAPKKDGDPPKLTDIRIHDLRHTCATLLLEQGTNPRVVQELLGHASVAITLGIYSHVRPDVERAAGEQLERSILKR